ncbi:MAG TPA: hypothetical protein PLD89_02415 [Promineifilum sp.]|nr:hypothetical protein [Promineifilum sp.]
MQRFVRRLGVVPVMMLSAGLFLLGVLAVDRIINTMWLFDVTRIDLARAVVQQRADAPTLLAAANGEILIAFLASVVVTFTGLGMVPIYYLNKRLNPPDLRDQPPVFLSVVRQSLFVGLWAAFCVWLQMNRTFGVAVALLAAAVLVLFEMVLQIRNRAAAVTEQSAPQSQ